MEEQIDLTESNVIDYKEHPDLFKKLVTKDLPEKHNALVRKDLDEFTNNVIAEFHSDLSNEMEMIFQTGFIKKAIVKAKKLKDLKKTSTTTRELRPGYIVDPQKQALIMHLKNLQQEISENNKKIDCLMNKVKPKRDQLNQLSNRMSDKILDN